MEVENLNGEETTLWKEVLMAKYGNQIVNNVILTNVAIPSFATLWWKDVCHLEMGVGPTISLEEVIVRKLGNGMLIRFWKDIWIGEIPLCSLFPRLFSLSEQKEICVGELLKVEEGRRWWNFIWRRNLFQWELDLLNQLVSSLENISLSLDVDSLSGSQIQWRVSRSSPPMICF
jgi:mannosylglycoprotein endo-beta-mannosidase